MIEKLQQKLTELEDYTNEVGYRKWLKVYNELQDLKAQREDRPYIPLNSLVRFKRSGSYATFLGHSKEKGCAVLDRAVFTGGLPTCHVPYDYFEVRPILTNGRNASVGSNKQTFDQLRGE